MTNTGACAVSAENLVIAFGGFRAVDGISFSVNRGEIFGFLGANGAGKTTTIRAFAACFGQYAGGGYRCAGKSGRG